VLGEKGEEAEGVVGPFEEPLGGAFQVARPGLVRQGAWHDVASRPVGAAFTDPLGQDPRVREVGDLALVAVEHLVGEDLAEVDAGFLEAGVDRDPAVGRRSRLPVAARVQDLRFRKGRRRHCGADSDAEGQREREVELAGEVARLLLRHLLIGRVLLPVAGLFADGAEVGQAAEDVLWRSVQAV
jgi:hypothetical protein